MRPSTCLSPTFCPVGQRRRLGSIRVRASALERTPSLWEGPGPDPWGRKELPSSQLLGRYRLACHLPLWILGSFLSACSSQLAVGEHWPSLQGVCLCAGRQLCCCEGEGCGPALPVLQAVGELGRHSHSVMKHLRI